MSDKRIYKYPLDIKEYQNLFVHKGAKPLYVKDQLGQLCIWFLVDVKEDLTLTPVYIVGTGSPMPENLPKYVGTTELQGLVLHVFA